MNIEDLVRDSIDHGVDSLPKRAPDPELLGARTRRSAAIRIALPALAAIAVIAIVSVFAVDKLGSSEPAVTGTDDPVSYMSWPGKVHLDGQTYKAPHAKGDAFAVNTLTDAGFIYKGGDDNVYLIGSDGEERRLAATNPENLKRSFTTLAGSADQRYAAWATQERGQLRLSLFDAQAGRVVAHRSVDCGSITLGGGTCSEYNVTAVADGIVYLSPWATGRAVSVAWNPSLPASQQVYRVTESGTNVTAVAAKTVMVTGKGSVYDRTGAPLGDDWTIVRSKRGIDENGPSTVPTLTPDGRWYFVVGGKEESAREDTSYAVDTTTDERVELVPNTGEIQIDDDGSVLIMTNGNGGTDLDILDCALPSGECTTAVEDIDLENDALIGG